MRVVIDVYKRPKDKAWVTDVYVNNRFSFSLVSPLRGWCLPHALHLVDKFYGDAAKIELHGDIPDELQENPS